MIKKNQRPVSLAVVLRQVCTDQEKVGPFALNLCRPYVCLINGTCGLIEITFFLELPQTPFNDILTCCSTNAKL